MKNDRLVAGVNRFANAPSAHISGEARSGWKLRFIGLTLPALAAWTFFGAVEPVNAAETVAAGNDYTVQGVRLALNSEAAGNPHQSTGNPHQSYAGDSAYSALSAYAQQIGIDQAEVGRAKAVSFKITDNSGRDSNAGHDFGDAAYSALSAYARDIGADQSEAAKGQPGKGQMKLAEADNLLDALREWQQKGSSPQSSPSTSGDSKKPVAGGTKSSKAPVEATYVGAKVCLGCHATQAAAFGKTLMGRIGQKQKGKFDCENCHGPGSAHVKAGGGRGVGGIISFRPNDDSRTAEENNAICLGCHEKGNRTLWHGSIHQSRGLMCTNCHTVMKDVSRKHQLKTKNEPETCFQCHKDVRSKMMRSEHMPVREGKMGCTSCHNPHGSYNDKLLKEATVNDVCFQCHAEKRGPFLWEHPPVVENCLNCHDPHGAINDNMLQVSRPRLCQRCHNVYNFHPANPRGPSTLYTVNSSCVNCHSQIHGSNSPAGQNFHR